MIKSALLFMLIYVPVFLAVQYFFFDAELDTRLFLGAFISGAIAAALMAFLQKKSKQ